MLYIFTGYQNSKENPEHYLKMFQKQSFTRPLKNSCSKIFLNVAGKQLSPNLSIFSNYASETL